MMRPNVTKSCLVIGFSLAVLARPASAEDRCVLRGDATMASAVGIFDAPSEGTELGHFTGVKTPLTVVSFADGSEGRSLVETAGFRIKGYVRARDIPAYTTRAVPVFGAHLSIGEGRRVVVIGSAPGRLRLEKTSTSPVAGVFQGWAPCDGVALSPHEPPGWAPPGGARGYLAKRPRLELFDQPLGDLVVSVARAVNGPGIPFWGGDTSEGFVHVEHHGEVVIDAWVRLRDLVLQRGGETSDQRAPTPLQSIVPKRELQGRAKVVRTTTAVQLRAAATDGAVTIGTIDAGVDVVVVDVVAGWASVMPTTFAFAPSGPAQFWVHARDLGV
jgi:hypothetical protein